MFRSVIIPVYREMNRRKLFTYASSSCYYLFMSIVPVVMLFCSILQFTPFTETVVLSYIDQYFEASLAELIRNIIIPIYNSGAAAFTISIVLTLYSASGAIKAIMAGIDAAYDFKKEGSFLANTLQEILYMILLLIAVLLVLCVLVYGDSVLLLIQKYIPGITIFNALLSKARFLIGMVLLVIFFIILYTYMPAEKVQMKDQIPGAIFTSVVWVVFSSIFSFYVSVSDNYGAYGIIGTVIISMMWIYYCLLVVMVGGLINSMNAPRRERRLLHKPRREDREE